MSGATHRALSNFKTVLASNIFVNRPVLLQPVRYFSVTESRKMKIVQFSYCDSPKQLRVGYVADGNIVDVNHVDPSIPCTLIEILSNGDFHKVKTMSTTSQPTVPLKSVQLKSPITGMDKILGVGLNYMDHCTEQNLTPPPVPMIFSKFRSCAVGQDEPVLIREEATKQVDWEVELAVVIGKRTSQITANQAPSYIFGYTVAQDITARDWQKAMNGGQFTLGKGMETFCPLGPWIVTSDEISDPENLKIQCSINGQLKQCSNTGNLIHKIASIIERLSTVMTLYPGDVILTGTPGGVGVHRKPQEFLKPGDTITSEIECIGVLHTKVEKYVNTCSPSN